MTTASTSIHSAEILEPIVIAETDNTRRVLTAVINDTKTEAGETVGVTLLHQRKKSSSEWENVKSINLSSLKGGEGVKIKLDSSQTKRLYDGLKKLYMVADKGIEPGEAEYAVGKINEVVSVPENISPLIKKLIDENHSEEIWESLCDNNPELSIKLSLARIHADRKESLIEFKNNINEDLNEPYWQNFFENNKWIFGYGLDYRILSTLTSQASYGGSDFAGQGEQRGDFLLGSEANIKFTVLVEIKKPSTSLMGTDYRNGAWTLGKEVYGGLSQIQANCRRWSEESRTSTNRDALERQNIYTVTPKGILVIGNTEELSDERDKIESFEAFRRSIHNIEILSFDELYNRAEFIVEQDIPGIQPQEEATDEDDSPF